jgi:hypothetical protein
MYPWDAFECRKAILDFYQLKSQGNGDTGSLSGRNKSAELLDARQAAPDFLHHVHIEPSKNVCGLLSDGDRPPLVAD